MSRLDRKPTRSTSKRNTRTKFDVCQKGPGETEFTKDGVEALPGLYVKTGLAAGGYEVKGQGRNSRGAGPDSEPATVR